MNREYNVEADVERRYNEMLERCGIDEHFEPRPLDKINIDYATGEGVGFERIRRITGYLVGDVSRWNNGKKAELTDREKHLV